MGLAGYVPPADTHVDTFGEHGLVEVPAQQCARFGEIGRGVFGAPYVGAYENHLVAILLFEGLCLTGEDGVDTAYFVADFPACFKEQVYFLTAIIHYLSMINLFEGAKLAKNTDLCKSIAGILTQQPEHLCGEFFCCLCRCLCVIGLGRGVDDAARRS